jgi:hypothetical protein
MQDSDKALSTWIHTYRVCCHSIHSSLALNQMQLKLTRFQTLSCIRSDAILHASVAKSGHTNTTQQQKFKHMLKRLSMLQNLTKLSTSKQNLQLLFSLRNHKGAKDKDIIELKWT